MRNLLTGMFIMFAVQFLTLSATAQIRQSTLAAETQPDSPISIYGLSMRELSNGAARLSFYQQNIGDKPIRTAAFEVVDGGGGKQVNTAFFCGSIICGFAPGATLEGGSTEEEGGFLHARGLRVRVDFVLFVDGTSWGSDRNNESKVSFGYVKGFETILGFTRRLVDEGSDEKLKKLLSTSLSDSDIATITGSSDNKWIKGYRFGYNMTRGALDFAMKCNGKKKCPGLGKLADELTKFESSL